MVYDIKPYNSLEKNKRKIIEEKKKDDRVKKIEKRMIRKMMKIKGKSIIFYKIDNYTDRKYFDCWVIFMKINLNKIFNLGNFDAI